MLHLCGYKPYHCLDTADTPGILDLLTLLSPLMSSLPGLYPSSCHVLNTVICTSGHSLGVTSLSHISHLAASSPGIVPICRPSIKVPVGSWL